MPWHGRARSLVLIARAACPGVSPLHGVSPPSLVTRFWRIARSGYNLTGLQHPRCTCSRQMLCVRVAPEGLRRKRRWDDVGTLQDDCAAPEHVRVLVETSPPSARGGRSAPAGVASDPTCRAWAQGSLGGFRMPSYPRRVFRRMVDCCPTCSAKRQH
ncbi:hypothetical protein GE09DRAFT_1165501 [Coniochaeta sp. 2T2.1]|nr:hypothetical protein GE09DRAFT_1165501 [Coniochaeta sp. 2T2.1]